MSEEARTCCNCGYRGDCEWESFFPCERHKTDEEYAEILRAVFDAMLKGEEDED